MIVAFEVGVNEVVIVGLGLIFWMSLIEIIVTRRREAY